MRRCMAIMLLLWDCTARQACKVIGWIFWWYPGTAPLLSFAWERWLEYRLEGGRCRDHAACIRITSKLLQGRLMYLH